MPGRGILQLLFWRNCFLAEAIVPLIGRRGVVLMWIYQYQTLVYYSPIDTDRGIAWGMAVQRGIEDLLPIITCLEARLEFSRERESAGHHDHASPHPRQSKEKYIGTNPLPPTPTVWPRFAPQLTDAAGQLRQQSSPQVHELTRRLRTFVHTHHGYRHTYIMQHVLSKTAVKAMTSSVEWWCGRESSSHQNKVVAI